MKRWIAIDPGASGGIAYEIDVETGSGATACVVRAEAMPPTDADIADLLRRVRGSDCSAILEDIPKFVGNNIPGSSVAVLFQNYGVIRGVLTALKVPIVLVRPHDWQKHYHLGTRNACNSPSEWKNKLKAEAQRRFPFLTITLKTADALLMLDYAKTL